MHLLNNPMKGKYIRHRHSEEQLKTGKSGRNSCYELMGVTHLLIRRLLEWMNVYGGARRHINEQSSYSSRQQQCSLFRPSERNVRLKHHSSSAGMQSDDVISHLQHPSHGLWRCAMRLACACSAVARPMSRYKYWLRSAFSLCTAMMPARREVSSLFFSEIADFWLKLKTLMDFNVHRLYRVVWSISIDVCFHSSFPYFSVFACPCFRPIWLAVRSRAHRTHVNVSYHLVIFVCLQGCRENI